MSLWRALGKNLFPCLCQLLAFLPPFSIFQNQQQEIRASYTILLWPLLLTPSFASKDPCDHTGPTQESRIIPLRSSDLATLIPPVTVIPFCPTTYIQRFWALGCGHFWGLGICLPQHIMPKCPVETSHSLQYSMKRTIHHYFTNSRHCLSVCQWTISQIVFFFAPIWLLKSLSTFPIDFYSSFAKKIGALCKNFKGLFCLLF